MMLSESMLRQKTFYDKLVDRFGTEHEFAEDIVNYISNDALRCWQMFHIALKYISQNRNFYTANALIVNSLNSSAEFENSFDFDKFFVSPDIETREYLNDLLKESCILFSNGCDSINNNIEFRVNFKRRVIKCILKFDKFYDMSVYSVIKTYVTSTSVGSNLLDEFLFNISEGIINISSNDGNSVCNIFENAIKTIYKIA